MGRDRATLDHVPLSLRKRSRLPGPTTLDERGRAMSSPAAGRTAGQVVDGPPSRQRPRPPGRGRYVRLMAENTASDTERRGCLLAKGAAELAQHDPTVAGRSAETMRALLTLLRTEISAAQRHGDIDSAADPERLAALLLTVVRGIEAVGKAGLVPETPRNIADTALAVLPMPEGQKRLSTGRGPAREN